jgi:pathogenesis-related protein 1
MRVLLLLSLFICNSVLSQTVPVVTGSKITQLEAQKILDHHNKVRKQVKTEKLTWSNSLSAYAQQWAENLAQNKNCRLVHSNCVDNTGKRLGENLFWGSDQTAYSPIDASISWYEEISYYDGGPVGGSRFGKYGHYTQMVWKTTREVGVGVAYCKDGGIIVCASYYPSGNVIGQTAY